MSLGQSFSFFFCASLWLIILEDQIRGFTWMVLREMNRLHGEVDGLISRDRVCR